MSNVKKKLVFSYLYELLLKNQWLKQINYYLLPLQLCVTGCGSGKPSAIEHLQSLVLLTHRFFSMSDTAEP